MEEVKSSKGRLSTFRSAKDYWHGLVEWELRDWAKGNGIRFPQEAEAMLLRLQHWAATGLHCEAMLGLALPVKPVELLAFEQGQPVPMGLPTNALTNQPLPTRDSLQAWIGLALQESTVPVAQLWQWHLETWGAAQQQLRYEQEVAKVLQAYVAQERLAGRGAAVPSKLRGWANPQSRNHFTLPQAVQAALAVGLTLPTAPNIAHTQAARNGLMGHYLCLALSAVLSQANLGDGEAVLDAVLVAVEALWDGLGAYDPRRGLKPDAFLQRRVQLALERWHWQQRYPHLSQQQQEGLRRLKAARAQLHAAGQVADTVALAQQAQLSLDQVEYLLQAEGSPLSLDAVNDTGTPLAEVLATEQNPQALEEEVREVLQRLPEPYRKALLALMEGEEATVQPSQMALAKAAFARLWQEEQP